MEHALTAEAILFFDDHRIVKEMTYLEFQAILDSYVPLHDVANRSMGAVYVRIDAKYHITSTVFFRINFDREGFVEKSWNIPLQQLADKAAKGPNLGAGPIGLACFSQCPIEWQKDSLWDPEMQATNNDFHTIKKAIKNNKLGIIFNVDSAAYDEYEQSEPLDEERTRTARIIKEQRLRQKLLLTKAEQDIRQLNLDHQQRIYDYQQKYDELQQVFEQEKQQRIELEEKSKGQADKIEGMREYFEAKLEKRQENEEAVNTEALKEYYNTELAAESDRLADEYQSELQSRDVELLYRREQESQLQQEIGKLKQEKQALAEGSRDIIFHHLSDAGVNFVVYHPGVGHLAISADEIDSYLANTNAFAANKCGVNEPLYSAWLDHYHSPTCQKQLDNGHLCGEPVTQLEDPSQFVTGKSNCCAEHCNGETRVVSIKSVPNTANKNGSTELAL